MQSAYCPVLSLFNSSSRLSSIKRRIGGADGRGLCIRLQASPIHLSSGCRKVSISRREEKRRRATSSTKGATTTTTTTTTKVESQVKAQSDYRLYAPLESSFFAWRGRAKSHYWVMDNVSLVLYSVYLLKRPKQYSNCIGERKKISRKNGSNNRLIIFRHHKSHRYTCI